MWKKFAVATLLLLVSHGTVFGAIPSAFDIFSQMYAMQPGTDVKVAYDLLGPPHETNDEPHMLFWHFAPNRIVFILLRNNSIIENISYIEIYEQMELAAKRCEELKQGFCEIIGLPGKETKLGTGWFIKDSIFAVDYVEVDYTFNASVYFFETTR